MVKTRIQPQSLADDRHQDINRHGNPNLGLNRVLAGTEKCFDPQVLLDPFEKQFHLPPRFVDLGNGKCGQYEIVGEKLQPVVGVSVVVTHTPQSVRIGLG